MESQKVDLVKGNTQMKCPICNGKGYVYNALGSFYEDCGHCQGTGMVSVEGEPMTEQEYLQTCNTEQLAEFIIKAMLFYDNAGITVLEAIKNAVEDKENLDGYFMERVLEWLKQPHTNE